MTWFSSPLAFALPPLAVGKDFRLLLGQRLKLAVYGIEMPDHRLRRSFPVARLKRGKYSLVFLEGQRMSPCRGKQPAYTLERQSRRLHRCLDAWKIEGI
jgi:hypothetical protein